MKQIILDLNTDHQSIEITEDSEVLGLFVGHDLNKLTTKLEIIHNKPELSSLTMIKAVVYDQARFDMTGNLVINTGARNTDAYLRIDVLLMSDEASARAVPSLEITEDSVKGGHGATVGQVDAEQLFYLRCRGLSQPQAEHLLVTGFIQELIDKIEDKEMAEKLSKNTHTASNHE